MSPFSISLTGSPPFLNYSSAILTGCDGLVTGQDEVDAYKRYLTTTKTITGVKCDESSEASGSMTLSAQVDPDPNMPLLYNYTCSGTMTGIHGGIGGCNTSICSDLGAESYYSGDGGFPAYPCTRSVTTLSDEYTTAVLKANTISALPDYSGNFTEFSASEFTNGQSCCDCSAYGHLSEDESSYTIRRFKYKFTFGAAISSFTIHWKERFTPEGGGAGVDTDMSEVISIGATESSVNTADEPPDNGTVTIADIQTTIP